MIKNRNSIDKTKILFGGNIGNQEFINDYINKIKESFFLSPSYFKITKNDDTNTTYDALIQDETDNPSKDGITKKKIALYPGQTLNWGDYIHWTSQNETFLVTEKNISPYYDNGKMERCNNKLKFINSDGIIVEYPCIITMESLTRYLDVQNTKDFMIPKDIFLVSFQSNFNTLQIKEGMRFILDGDSFKVMGKSKIVMQGMIQIKLQSDLFRDGLDNVNGNGLADQTGLITDNYTISILNNNFSAKVGETVQLNVQLLNDGNIEPSILSQFNFVSSDTNIATIDENGLITVISEGTCQITCNLKENTTITSSINITGVNSIVTTNVTYDLTPNSNMGYVIKKSTINTFTAHKYDNGVEIASTFDFDINYNGVSASDIAIIETTNTYIKIKNASVDTTTPYKTIFVLYREVGTSTWLSKEVILKGIYG